MDRDIIGAQLRWAPARPGAGEAAGSDRHRSGGPPPGSAEGDPQRFFLEFPEERCSFMPLRSLGCTDEIR